MDEPPTQVVQKTQIAHEIETAAAGVSTVKMLRRGYLAAKFTVVSDWYNPGGLRAGRQPK